MVGGNNVRQNVAVGQIGKMYLLTCLEIIGIGGEIGGPVHAKISAFPVTAVIRRRSFGGGCDFFNHSGGGNGFGIPVRKQGNSEVFQYLYLGQKDRQKDDTTDQRSADLKGGSAAAAGVEQIPDTECRKDQEQHGQQRWTEKKQKPIVVVGQCHGKHPFRLGQT